MDQTVRVAVIGAGVSGLACARSLERRGATVTVFEKNARPGGRLATKARGGRSFDHGAQYLTVRHTRFERAVSDWRALGLVELWRGRIVRIDEDGRPGDSRPGERLVGVPSMRSLPEYLAVGSDVRSGVRVTSVQRIADAWVLGAGPDEQHGPFDAVIVAVPAPQAVPLLQGAPPLAERASRVIMEPCWSVMVELGGPLDRPYDAAFVRGGPLSWIARDNSKPGRDDVERWVLHAGPAWSRAHLDAPRAAVEHRMLQAFLALGNGDLHATHVRAHRWRYALPTTPLPSRCLFDVRLGLGACGDWCGGPRVEGAFLSGVAVADHVLLRPPMVAT